MKPGQGQGKVTKDWALCHLQFPVTLPEDISWLAFQSMFFQREAKVLTEDFIKGWDPQGLGLSVKETTWLEPDRRQTGRGKDSVLHLWYNCPSGHQRRAGQVCWTLP